MKRTLWVERKFDFNYPIGVFPYIIERLRGTPARIEDMIKSYPANILTVRINNKWSIQEHIGHLLDLEELHDGRIDDYKNGLKILRPADINNKKTYEANHNANSIQNITSSFNKARKHFVNRLEELDEEMLSRSAIHPRLQKEMRVIDLAFFVAEHDDHHLASITELANILQREKS
jgi:uncharacterized damage-inducible protein DinB